MCRRRAGQSVACACPYGAQSNVSCVRGRDGNVTCYGEASADSPNKQEGYVYLPTRTDVVHRYTARVKTVGRDDSMPHSCTLSHE